MSHNNEYVVPTTALHTQPQDGDRFELLKDDNSSQQKFRMVANSGGVIEGHPHWNNFAIDLAGLKVGKQRKPALRDHDAQRIVGHTQSIKVTSEGLVAEGTFSDTPDGREVSAMLASGFPWQCSVYVPPQKIERIEEGQEIEVNGHTLTGPGHVFRESSLREVTFTALGADENTDAAQLSKDITINAVVFSAAQSDEEVQVDHEPKIEDGAEVADTADAVTSSDQNESTPAEQFTAGYEKGVEAERERVLKIVDSALSHQGDIAKEHISLGMGIEDSLVALLKDARESMDAKLQHTVDSTPEPVGPMTDEPGTDLRAAFDADPTNAAEFGNFEVWEAYQRARKSGAIRPGRDDQ